MRNFPYLETHIALIGILIFVVSPDVWVYVIGLLIYIVAAGIGASKLLRKSQRG